MLLNVVDIGEDLIYQFGMKTIFLAPIVFLGISCSSVDPSIQARAMSIGLDIIRLASDIQAEKDAQPEVTESSK